MAKKTKKTKKDKEKNKVRKKVKTRGPFADLENRFHELERRFNDVVPEGWSLPADWTIPEWSKISPTEFKTPRVDIVDRDNDILVRADVPGVKTENLDVSLTSKTITIKGSTMEQKNEEQGDYYRSETMRGKFCRTMSLPSDVDGSKVESSFKDGVLELVVPKLEKAKRIKVDVS